MFESKGLVYVIEQGKFTPIIAQISKFCQLFFIFFQFYWGEKSLVLHGQVFVMSRESV